MRCLGLLAPTYFILLSARPAVAVPSPTPGYSDTLFISRNAFRPSELQTLEVRVSAGTAGNYSICVYNSAGKKVRSLHDGGKSVSSEIIALWDGKNDSGDLVAAGVYVIHAQTPHWTQDRRVVVLR